MKNAALIALLALGSGCFTTIGGVVGSTHTKHRTTLPPDNSEGTYVAEGLLVGLLADLALVLAVRSALDSSFWYSTEAN